MRFDEILTNDDVLDGLWDMHFDECTPIQEQTIPSVLEERFCSLCAQTGTGKTAAYLLPVINNRLADGGFPSDAVNCVRGKALPENLQQIDRQLQDSPTSCRVKQHSYIWRYRWLRLRPATERTQTGSRCEVIATPGRLLAHPGMGYVDLSEGVVFILDEGDRMLDMDSTASIMQIYSHLPRIRRVLMFSATNASPKYSRVASKILKNHFEVKIAGCRSRLPRRSSSSASIYAMSHTKTRLFSREIFEGQPLRNASQYFHPPNLR